MEGLELDKLREIEFTGQAGELPEFILNREVPEMAPNMEVQAEEIKDVFVEIPELQYENERAKRRKANRDFE